MTDNNQREYVSAFMDGELGAQDGERLITALRDEAEFGQCWARYHLIGEALRNNLPGPVSHDLAQRVSQALDSEPTVLAPPRRAAPAYLRPVVSWTLAASVAAIAVIGFNRSDTAVIPASAPTPVAMAPVTSMPAPPAAASSVPLLASAAVAQPAPLAHELPKEVRARFTRYLLSHSQAATAVAGGPGVLSSARLVGYEPER